MQQAISGMEADLRSDELMHDLPLSQLRQYDTCPLNIFVRCQHATVMGLPEHAVTPTDKASGQQPRNGVHVVIVHTHKMIQLNLAEAVVDVRQVTKDGKAFGDEFRVAGNMLRAHGMQHEHFLISLFVEVMLARDGDCPKN